MRRKFLNHNGFTMIEVLIALVVFSFGLLAMNSMQVMSIRSNAIAANMMTANTLAQSMIDRIHSDPSNVTTFATSTTVDYNGWQTNVANTLPTGAGSVAVAPAAASSNQVTVTVAWQQDGNHSVVLTTLM